MIILLFLNWILQFPDDIVLITYSLIGIVKFLVQCFNFVLHRWYFLNQLQLYSLLLGKIQLELFFIPGKGVLLFGQNLLLLFFQSMKFVIMSFSLLFNQLLVLGDLPIEWLNRNVLFEQFISKATNLFFDVKSVFLAIRYDTLSPWLFELFARSHFSDLLLGWNLKLQQLIFKNVIFGNQILQIGSVFGRILFANQSQMLKLLFFFVE